MFTFTRNGVRQIIVLAALGLAFMPAAPVRAAETFAQSVHYRVAAKVRSWSRCVVKLQLTTDHATYVGTAAYVIGENGQLFLITADHVVNTLTILDNSLRFRSFNADPDDADEWHSITDYADRITHVSGADLAIIHLASPLPGMTPAKVADAPAQAGDTILAFGFAADDGHEFAGKVTGFSDDGRFLAARLGADHGDSGGPVFEAVTGRIVGLIDSSASPEMADQFKRTGEEDHARTEWSKDGTPLGADTLIIHLPALENQ